MWQVCFLAIPFCCFYLMFSSSHIYRNSTQEVRESAGLAFSTLYKVFELKPVLNFWYYGWFVFFFFFLTYSPYIECWAASHWWDCPHITTGFGRWWYICNSPWWSKADFKVFFYSLFWFSLIWWDQMSDLKSTTHKYWPLDVILQCQNSSCFAPYIAQISPAPPLVSCLLMLYIFYLHSDSTVLLTNCFIGAVHLMHMH